MLKINKKVRISLMAGLAVIGGGFLYKYLTFVPEYSAADSISTTDPVTLPKIEGTITAKFGTEAQGYKTYMQEISLSYCQSLPDKTTGQLADGRDGKIYWVTVLGTGAAKTCWMTQDLDLDINKVTFTTTNDGDNMYKGSDTTWTGNSVASKSSWTSNNNDIQWYERDTTHGTTHTSLGNLYSFEAATAGTGHNVTANNTPTTGSICPKGWKLPLSGNSANTAKGSFQSLQAVGMTSNTLANSDPYYFQYGGYISESLSNVGYYGIYWSATPSTNNYAYSLFFNTDRYFNITYNSFYRFQGCSVRCVVRDASYVPPVTPSGSVNNPNISVTVPSLITLDVYSDNVDNKIVNINPNNTGYGEGEFTAKVSSNSSYNLSLSTIENGHTDLKNDKVNASIPAISTTSPIVTTNDKSWWGIKCTNPAGSTNCTKTEYTGLTTSTVPYFSSNSNANNQLINFNIGIKTSPDLPSGTYSTSILVTASQN